MGRASHHRLVLQRLSGRQLPPGGQEGRREGSRRTRRGCWRHQEHLRQLDVPRELGEAPGAAAREGRRAAVLLVLRRQRLDAVHAVTRAAVVPHLLRRWQPRFDDPGNQEQRCAEAHLPSQRSVALARASDEGAQVGAEDRRLRNSPLDDGRGLPVGGALRHRAPAWSADIRGRSSRRRTLRRAWRGHRRAGPSAPQHGHHLGYARKGVRQRRRLHRVNGEADRHGALVRRRIYLHDFAAADRSVRRDESRGDSGIGGGPRVACPPSGERSLLTQQVEGRRLPRRTHAVAHHSGQARQSAALHANLRHDDPGVRALRSGHQLPDGPARRGEAPPGADSLPHERDD